MTSRFVHCVDILSFKFLSSVMSCLKLIQPKGVLRIQGEDTLFIDRIRKQFQLKLQRPKKIKKDWNIICRGQTSLEEAKSRKYKKIIDFGDRLSLSMFAKEFKDKLLELSTQYNIFMKLEGFSIALYSESQISSIFETEILTLKNKLNWHIFEDQQMFLKLKYSSIIPTQLKQRKIHYYLLRNNNICLQSSLLKINQIKKVKRLFNYNAVVIQFRKWYLTNQINRVYFLLLISAVKELLETIQSCYDILVEIGHRRMGIVLHTRDPIFESQPKRQLKKYLQNIIFISYYTAHPEVHVSKIRQDIPRSRSVQLTSTRCFVYSSWNKNISISQSQILDVFKHLFLELSLNSSIKISYSTGGLSINILQNVLNLAYKHRFHVEYLEDELKQEDKEIVEIKFKSFINKKKKIRQLSQFLQQLLCQSKDFVESTILNNTVSDEGQTAYDIQEAVEDIQKNFQIKREIGNYFNSNLTNLITSNTESKGFKKGKRNRGFQQQILMQYLLSCKVWNLVEQENKNDQSSVQVKGNWKLYLVKQLDFLCLLRSNWEVEAQNLQKIEYKKAQKKGQYYLISEDQQTHKSYLTHAIEIFDS